MSNSSIWFIDRTQSGATNLGQSGPGNDANEGVLCIPQSFNITGASPSNCLLSYPRHSLVRAVGSYLSGEMQLVYSTAPWLDYKNLNLELIRSQLQKMKRKISNLKLSHLLTQDLTSSPMKLKKYHFPTNISLEKKIRNK